MNYYRIHEEETCQRCQIEPKESIYEKSGSHIKQSCKHCGSYIKFTSSKVIDLELVKEVKKQSSIF